MRILLVTFLLLLSVNLADARMVIQRFTPDGPVTCTPSEQDFTSAGWSEGDVYNQITRTADTITWIGAGNNTAYVRKDFDAGYFNGPLTFKFRATQSSTGAENYGADLVAALTNLTSELYTSTDDWIGVQLRKGTGDPHFRIVKSNGGTLSYSAAVYTTADTENYVVFTYDPSVGDYGQYQIDIYTGSYGGTLLGSSTSLAIEPASFRYLYSYDTWKDGNAYDSRGTVSNYEVGKCLE